MSFGVCAAVIVGEGAASSDDLESSSVDVLEPASACVSSRGRQVNVVCIVMQSHDGEERVGSEKQTASAQHNHVRNSFTLIDFAVGFCEAAVCVVVVVGRSATRDEP
jgi:hypothetical protein